MIEGQIVDLTLICQSFPQLPHSQISRDNLLNLFLKTFSGDTELLIVEGDEGIGKTLLLAQFVMKKSFETLSIFIKPTSRWAYDPESLRFDLCNQVEWLLNGTQLDANESVDDTFLRRNWVSLYRYANRYKKTIFFVIDGLDQIPEDEFQTRKIIVDMLPFGYAPFRFLLSGDPHKLLPSIRSPKIRYKTHILAGFSLDETIDYLKSIQLDRETIKEIYNLCGGNPGYLSSIRRILESEESTSIQNILEEIQDKLSRLLEIEWNRANINNDRQKRLLAFVCFSRRGYTLEDISRILSIEEEVIYILIQNLKFVIINQQTSEISFVSEAFRKFVMNKLGNLKDEIDELIINDLLQFQESDDALIYLPSILDSAERYNELVNYLTLDHCMKMIERSQSLIPAEQKTRLGVKAALHIKKDHELIRLGVQGSLLEEIDSSEAWRSEIEAKLALKDYNSAITLAQSHTLREDRLHLLSIIAKTQKEQGLSINEEILVQIKNLYDQIDKTTLDKRALEIATDLIFTAPDLAIKLVEASINSKDRDNALDWAFAKLSAVTLGANKIHLHSVDTVENIHLRIKDPIAMRFYAAATLLQEEYSMTKVLEITEKFENVSDRIYMLRLWAMKNKRRADAFIVVEYTLDLIIKTTAYSPNAKVLRELASPLPYIIDKEKLKQLVSSFDSQRGTMEHIGPTQDYVRLQLLLAQAEVSYDVEIASNRIVDSYFYISKLEDLEIKCECLAWLISFLKKIDPEMLIEKKEGIYSLAKVELNQEIAHLLDTTADHYQVTQGIIIALAENHPDFALEIAHLQNIENRREIATLDLIKEITTESVNIINLPFIMKSLDSLTNKGIKDAVIYNVVTHLSDLKAVSQTLVSDALPIIARIKDMEDAGFRCLTSCAAYIFLMKQNSDAYTGLCTNLLNLLEKAWTNIDVEWHKIDIGFSISKGLSKVSFEQAENYLRATEAFRELVIFDSEKTALAYIHCIKVAARIYGGLLPKMIGNFNEDIQRLSKLINNIVSSGERAKLWIELALVFYMNKRFDEGNNIVRDFIKPLLKQIPEGNQAYLNEVIINASPALYFAHKRTAVEQLQQLDQNERNQACRQICDFIIYKRFPTDPYEALPMQGYDVTYEDIVDICELLDITDNDADICFIIGRLCDSIASRRYRDRFSAQQKADIGNRFKKVIDSKLPSRRFISHDGYKIATKAQIARLEQSNSQIWTLLIDEANQIPNIADKALVLAMIAEAMPTRAEEKRKNLLKEARELIKKIPAIFDRVEHYKDLASITVKTEPSMYKDLLKLAMIAASESQNEDKYPLQRRLIDVAYNYDPEFAASLASIVDDDPARKKIQRRLQVLKLKKEIANQFETDKRASEDVLDLDYTQIAWMLLGSLNAGAITPKNMSQLRDFIQIASGLPFSKSYHLYVWIIENIIKSYAKTDQAKDYIRNSYESMLNNIELIWRISGRSLKQFKQTQRQQTETASHENTIIQPGERDKAIQFIKDWFVSNVDEYLKISDEYFGPNDLEILLLLRSVKPDCRVQILTSKQVQDNEKIGVPNEWEKAYGNHWRLYVSSVQDPPDTEITVIGTISNGESPLHDRWWLTKGSGIRIGTSFNGLGKKLTEISILSSEIAAEREKEVDLYLHWLVREYKGEKLLRWVFPLH